MGHSDIDLTVKRYGQFAAEAREQWTWAALRAEPVEQVASRGAALTVVRERASIWPTECLSVAESLTPIWRQASLSSWTARLETRSLVNDRQDRPTEVCQARWGLR